jgi:hypothetical protein
VLFNPESYEESHAFLCHCNKVMAFCSVVGTVNRVKMASRLSDIGLQPVILSLSIVSFAGQRLSIVITDASVWQSLLRPLS